MVGDTQVDPNKPCHTSKCPDASASIAIVGGILSQCSSGRGKEIGQKSSIQKRAWNFFSHEESIKRKQVHGK